MNFKIRPIVKIVYKVIPYFFVFYILNKNLFDWITFGFSKILYYGMIAIGALLCFRQMILKRQGKDILISFSIYCFFILLNGILLSSKEQFFVGIKEYLTFPLPFFALLFYMDGKKNYDILIRSIIWWGGITGLLAIYEYVVGESVLPGFAGKVYLFQDGTQAYRSTVFIGSPMVLGIALGAAVILGLYYFYVKKEYKLLIPVLISFAGLFCTGSRGPLVCCVGGLFVMCTLFIAHGAVPIRYIKRVVVLAGLVVGFFGIFALFPDLSTGIDQIDFLIYRVNSTFDFTGEWGNAERLKRWTYYLNEFIQKPIFGYGIASTSAEIASNPIITHHGITTESGILARLVETGLVGTVSYYIFVFVSIKSILRYLLKGLKDKNTNTFVFPVIGILMMIFVENIILQVTLNIFVTFIVWFFVSYTKRLLENEEVV